MDREFFSRVLSRSFKKIRIFGLVLVLYVPFVRVPYVRKYFVHVEFPAMRGMYEYGLFDMSGGTLPYGTLLRVHRFLPQNMGEGMRLFEA